MQEMSSVLVLKSEVGKVRKFGEVNMFFKRFMATGICALLPAVAMMFPGEKAAPPISAAPNSPVEAPSAVSEQDMYPRSSFDVNIMVDGVPLQEYYARGKTYIEATEGREYSVSIHNPLGVRVAVALAVDGMNSIDARRTTAYEASKWVIEPYGDITVSGWQMSGSRARRFYFTNSRDSYGAKLGQTANLGVISAVFYRENRQPPITITPRRNEDGAGDNKEYPDSPNESSGRAQSDSGARAKAAPSQPMRKPDDYAATGIGRSVRNDVRWLNLDLERNPVASIALRYEYRPELVRLGVLPAPYYPDPMERREKSTGFRDHRYSPEP